VSKKASNDAGGNRLQAGRVTKLTKTLLNQLANFIDGQSQRQVEAKLKFELAVVRIELVGRPLLTSIG
jgi:hypothetical protein